MAYVSQEKKAELLPGIKAVLKKYQAKGTVSVRNYSTLVVKVKSSPMDIIGNFMEKGETRHLKKPDYLEVNEYYIKEHFSGKVCDFLVELLDAMKKGGWYDNSDSQVDYFDIAYYTDIRIGSYDKPYEMK